MSLDRIARTAARSLSGRKPEQAELLSAVEDHVARELGELVAELHAPEQHVGFQLSPPVLHRGDIVIEAGESERPGGGLPIERKRHPVTRSAAQRRAIHPGPESRQALHGIEETFGKGRCPETRRRGHRPAGMGISRPQRVLVELGKEEERGDHAEGADRERKQAVLHEQPQIAGDLVVA